MSDRVYDAAQVDGYIARLHAHIQLLNDEIALLRERVSSTSPASSEAVERVLGRALLHVQRLADENDNELRTQRELILQEASEQAASSLAAARAEADAMLGKATQRAKAIAAEAERRATATGPAPAGTAGAAIAAAKARIDQRAAVWVAEPPSAPTFTTVNATQTPVTDLGWVDSPESEPNTNVIVLPPSLADAPPPTGPPVLPLRGNGIAH